MILPGMGMGFVGGAAGAASLSSLLAAAGLTPTALFLDPSDPLSYSSGQQWSDLIGTTHFFRGTSNVADGADPTYGGNHWLLDFGDSFLESAAHTTFDSWHKNNAVWTVVTVMKSPIGLSGTIIRNASGPTEHGILLRMDNNELTLDVENGTGTDALEVGTVATAVPGEWNFVAAAINEATGAAGLTFQINDTQESFNSTFTSPSATNPTDPTIIFDDFDVDTEVGPLLAWTTRLSTANLNTVLGILRTLYDIP